MSKAINWPAPYRDEVIAEGTEDLHCALRLGSLYYDNHYWVDGEEVVIRVNHKIIRKAVIVGELKCCPIQALTSEDYTAQKASLKTMEAVVSFLAQTYEQHVTPETEVTVVYYRNLPLNAEMMEVEDDPHMAASG